MHMSAVHGDQLRATGEGKNRQGRASSGTQSELPLISSMTRKVVDAPTRALLTVTSAAECLDWMMQASGSKGAYIAACIGKSEGYVSRLRSGKKPISPKNRILVRKLCMATGSNLLEKFFALHADENELRAEQGISALRSAA